MKINRFYLLLVSLFLSCYNLINKDEVYGKYYSVGYQNGRDTLTLFKNGKFNRVIYQNNNKTYSQNGKWNLSRDFDNTNYISFDYFYKNDDEVILDDTLFQNISKFGNTLLIRKNFGSLILIQNDDIGLYYYREPDNYDITKKKIQKD